MSRSGEFEPRNETEPLVVAYGPLARALHWVTALLVIVVAPIGVAMAYRGPYLNIWDGLTNTLYSSHKLIGFIVLWLVILRLVLRFARGAPPDEPSLEPLQRTVSHIVHWTIYTLLILVPLLGWIGIQLYPSLVVFDLFSLPSILAPDKALAERILAVHRWLAYALMGLVALHVGAALFHHLIRRDGVLIRMWPGARFWCR